MSQGAIIIVHNSICGGLAAAGFGVLFNAGLRTLPWCAASGGLALAVRTVAIAAGCSFETSSFLAALALGCAVQLLPLSAGVSRNVLHVVGCIPLVPGVFAADAILGLFALTQTPSGSNDALLTAIASAFRAIFTLGALGTGLAIPALLFRWRQVT